MSIWPTGGAVPRNFEAWRERGTVGPGAEVEPDAERASHDVLPYSSTTTVRVTSDTATRPMMGLRPRRSDLSDQRASTRPTPTRSGANWRTSVGDCTTSPSISSPESNSMHAAQYSISTPTDVRATP